MKARKPNSKGRPFLIRLTPQELEVLASLAGADPIGVYIRSRILGSMPDTRKSGSSVTVKDRELLGRCLAILGKSGIAENLKLLAQLARSGSLVCDAVVTARLRMACEDIASVRALLMFALGKEAPRATEPIALLFDSVAVLRRDEP